MKRSRIRINNRLFLYSGLSLLLISLIIRALGFSSVVWIPTLCIAILLKGIFLINIFNTKGFKMSLWLILILIGVVMIFTSMVFKYVYPIPFLRNILFYGAITLKASGLILMLVQKVRLGNK